MAKLTYAEFGERCGIDEKNVYVYISRGKLNVTPDREIDDQDLKNKDFIQKYMLKAKQKAIRRGESGEKMPGVVASEGVSGDGKQKPQRDPDTMLAWEKLEKQKAELQIKELEQKSIKLELQNRKSRGEFIPVDQVRFLLIQAVEGVHLAWENEFDDFLIQMSSKYGISREEMAKIKAEKVNVSNSARAKAISVAKTGLRRIQHEVSVQRGRGEHD